MGFGNGLFVAVGDAGKLFTSPDATTWTSRTSGAGASIINFVAYGGGLYVAGGESSYFRTSPDGITWTSRSSAMTTGSAAVWGNNLFVAVGSTSRIVTSPVGGTLDVVLTPITYQAI